MLLRPATPLSILFLAAFALLLLSTISTPIIKAIPLAEFDGVTYGVFGYCEGDSCSSMGIGYTTGMSASFFAYFRRAITDPALQMTVASRIVTPTSTFPPVRAILCPQS